MSTGPDLDLIPPAEAPERNWLPLGIAAATVLLVIAITLFFGRSKPAATTTPIAATPDAYAASLPVSAIVMSESSNLSGGKVTYLDGHIVNQGDRTVTAITVQVLFRNGANEVAQNLTEPLQFIRTREPYIDVEPVSAAPLKPGEGHDFRLIFDGVSSDWNGAYPDLRILRVETK